MTAKRHLPLVGLAFAGAGLAVALGLRPRRQTVASQHASSPERPTQAARELNGTSAVLSLAVLADSVIEHYRGSFQNRTMYVPLAVAAASLCGSLYGLLDRRDARHAARDAIYGAAAITGTIGLGFHAYNVTKRPGGLSWQNLFYAAPIGAPAALILAGLIGRAAEKVRDAPPGDAPQLLGADAGRVLARVCALGLLGTVGEVGLLHFRGAYHNPAMLLPVTLPPISALLLAWSSSRPAASSHRAARWSLRATAALGVGGVGFHAFGVARSMGGWRNWTQNLLNGPPLPAPPSFTGLALAGLSSLDLLQAFDD